jgi:hypothetical protein
VVVSASARMGPLPVREAWRAGSPGARANA